MVENSDMVFIPDIATAVVDPFIEAPVTIGYAMANRSAVVRIPAYVKSPDKKRFELRNPDATCNPYYAYAAILMAGLDGIRRKIDPAGQNWGPFVFNLFELSEEEKAKLGHLPASLDGSGCAGGRSRVSDRRRRFPGKSDQELDSNHEGRQQGNQQNSSSGRICPVL